jgi:hypothetical protein
MSGQGLIDVDLRRNRWLLTAGLLLLLYGLVEVLDSATLLAMQWGGIGNPYPSFVFQQINDLLNKSPLWLLPVFCFFAYFRLMAAVGILRNRLWGLWAAIWVEAITLVFVPFLLPMAGGDALGAILIVTCLLIGYLDRRPIVSERGKQYDNGR